METIINVHRSRIQLSNLSIYQTKPLCHAFSLFHYLPRNIFRLLLFLLKSYQCTNRFCSHDWHLVFSHILSRSRRLLFLKNINFIIHLFKMMKLNGKLYSRLISDVQYLSTLQESRLKSTR